MEELTKLLVPCYKGRTKELEKTESLLNSHGIITTTSQRRPGHSVLLKALLALSIKGAEFEATRIALKVMRGIDNPCNLINVGKTTFTIAATRCPVRHLPHRGFETLGNPVKWTNSNTAKITVPYEGNTGKESEIAEFIFHLPYKKR